LGIRVGLHPSGETRKLGDKLADAVLRRLYAKTYRQSSGEAEAGSAGEQPAEE
jgi:hypothetical protein